MEVLLNGILSSNLNLISLVSTPDGVKEASNDLTLIILSIDSETDQGLLSLFMRAEDNVEPLMHVCGWIEPCPRLVNEVIVDLEHHIEVRVMVIKLNLPEVPVIRLRSVLHQHPLVRVIELKPYIPREGLLVPITNCVSERPILFEVPTLVVNEDWLLRSWPWMRLCLGVSPNDV